MTSPVTLLPTSDGTIGAWGIFGGGTSNIYTAVDEGTDSPNDSDQIASGANANNSCFFLITDTPSDFGTATACTIKVRGNLGSTKGSYISQLSVQIVQSNESTAITNSVTQTLTGTTTTYTLAMTITGATDKTTWDGARLKLTTGSGTTGAIILSAAQVEVTYSTAAAASQSAAILIGCL